MQFTYYGQLPGLNEIIDENRRNKYAGAKQKRAWRHALELVFIIQMKENHWQGCQRHATVKVDFYEPDRRRDDDNVFGGLKIILDAMQDAKVIPKDSPKYCHVLPERFYDKQNPRIEIKVEEDNE